jgi:PAS domain S-box-containing protein
MLFEERLFFLLGWRGNGRYPPLSDEFAAPTQRAKPRRIQTTLGAFPVSGDPHTGKQARPMRSSAPMTMCSALAVLLLTIGTLVLFGWLADRPLAVRLHDRFPPMQANTAAGFILVGVAFMAGAFGRRWPTRIFATLAGALGGATLLEYIAGVDLGIDAMILDQSPDPNRMAPNTALCFTFIGVAIALNATSRPVRYRNASTTLLSSLVLVLGLGSMTGYLTGLSSTYTWGDVTRMAPHTASAFIAAGICGICLSLLQARQEEEQSAAPWIPGIAAICVWIFAGLIAIAIHVNGGDPDRPPDAALYQAIGWIVLAGGLLLGLLLAISLDRTAVSRAEIRERIRIEARLRETLRQLQLQKDAIDQHAIVAVTDPSGVITYVNDKFCEISGYTREELVNKTHRIINSDVHPKRLFVSLWRTIAQGRTWRGEICNKAKDGSQYWVDTTIVPFTNVQGEITQYVSIRTDVTEHKMVEEELLSLNEELRQKNGEMEQFAYSVSHDLKAPTVTIRGYVGFMRQDLAQGRTDRLEGFCESIQAGACKMREIIDDLLELSRVGRVINDLEIIDTPVLIRSIASEFAPQVMELGATIEIDDDLPQIWGDRTRIRQVFQNLIGNALKYARSNDHPPRIRVLGSVDDGHTQVCVQDDGPGIDPKYQDIIFGLFQRLETQSDGTGIGLAIAKRVCELHGGRITLLPTEGGGATFCVRLPLAPTATVQATHSTELNA